MHESPRIRRLRSDLNAMERLRSESSVLKFKASGKPTQHYIIYFEGKSLARVKGRVAIADQHQVEIKLGASYPRTMPEIRWLTPIYHPNISEIGMVCLGGYGTHWVPSLNLDELCGMLWDMARYHNYDVRSPYNREAALWVANQSTFAFPVDSRPLRDLRAALGRIDEPEFLDEPKIEPIKPIPPAKSEGVLGRYAQFVRKFADELNTIKPDGSQPVPVEPEGPIDLVGDAPSPPSPVIEDDASGLIFLLDDEPVSATQTQPTSRLRASDEDILFIE